MSVEEMQLTPSVALKARALQAAHPGVVFTSGRRTLKQQSLAMAANIEASGRRWIEKTYADSRAVRALQQYVDLCPLSVRPIEMASGLLQVMTRMPAFEQNSISRHLTGEAFDVEPNSCPMVALQALHPEKLLTHEGGLARWHLQF